MHICSLSSLLSLSEYDLLVEHALFGNQAQKRLCRDSFRQAVSTIPEKYFDPHIKLQVSAYGTFRK